MPDEIPRETLRDGVRALVMTSPTAPAEGRCFVHNGRVQVRAETLRLWLEEAGLGPVTTRDVARSLRAHGFGRTPFPYPDESVPSGQQSASYFWAEDPDF